MTTEAKSGAKAAGRMLCGIGLGACLIAVVFPELISPDGWMFYGGWAVGAALAVGHTRLRIPGFLRGRRTHRGTSRPSGR